MSFLMTFLDVTTPIYNILKTETCRWTSFFFPSISIFRRIWLHLCSVIWLNTWFSSVFELVFKGVWRKKTIWKSSMATLFNLTASYLNLKHAFFNETLFYFVIILELCVYPIKKIACLSHFRTSRLIWWFFWAKGIQASRAAPWRRVFTRIFVIKFVLMRYVLRAKLSSLDRSS